MIKIKLLFAFGACLLLGVPAFADVVALDFSHTGSGGTMNVTGLGTVASPFEATGSGIPITTLVETLNPGPSAVDVGQWQVKGSCKLGTTLNAAGCLSFDTTAKTISIVGYIPGVAGSLAHQLTLLTGTMTSFSVTNGTSAAVVLSAGFDTKSQALLTALHIHPTSPWEFTGSVIAAKTTKTVNGKKVTTFSPQSEDILNLSTVPEPGSIALLALLLFGCTVCLTRVAART